MISDTYLEKIKDPAWHQATVDEIFAQGYVLLPHFLTEPFFAEVQAFAEAHGHEEGGMMSFSKNDGTVGHTLARSPEFMALFEGLHQARCKKEGKTCTSLRPEKQVVGYPYKDARNGKRSRETAYHFDGAYVNATLAITMPEQGGELIAFPNIRKSPGAFLARAYARLLRHIPMLRRTVRHVVAKSRSNDLCLFFGDRTLHGVEPIQDGERLMVTINNHW
jgi:hypothetical protein